ncbi:MAG: hypothetical protein KGL35_24945 [Bradyrhizobium sp.]|nr:hypothetical protein [Bradyrhizobium sp.]
MEANFKQSLIWVREEEGGNDDDPMDSGGRTSRGITQREYDAYCRIAGLTLGDVWKAPDQIVDDIYHKSYWNPYCPTFPTGIDYLFFDHGVLAGPSCATIALQQALGVTADGHIGVVTSAALSHADPSELVDRMSAVRQQYYDEVVKLHPKNQKFMRGWANRVVFARKNAHALLAGGHV